MAKEFNLSKKIRECNGLIEVDNDICFVSDIKEFIKRLKEEMTIIPDEKREEYILTAQEITEANHKAIDKLAGDKFILQ